MIEHLGVDGRTRYMLPDDIEVDVFYSSTLEGLFFHHAELDGVQIDHDLLFIAVNKGMTKIIDKKGTIEVVSLREYFQRCLDFDSRLAISEHDKIMECLDQRTYDRVRRRMMH